MAVMSDHEWAALFKRTFISSSLCSSANHQQRPNGKKYEKNSQWSAWADSIPSIRPLHQQDFWESK